MADAPQYGELKATPDISPDVRMRDNSSLEAFGGGQGLEQATHATQGVAAEAGDIAQQEFNRANQVAHLAADNAAAQKQAEIQTNVSKMYGQNSLQAEDYVKKEWGQFQQEQINNAPNRDLQMALLRSNGARSQELFRYTQAHVSNEMEKFADEQFKGGIENATSLAVMNPYDPENVQGQLNRAHALIIDQAKRKGLGQDTDAFKAFQEQTMGGVHKLIIQTMLDKDDPQGVAAAKHYLADHKDEMGGQTYKAARNVFENAETYQQGMDAWQKMQGPEYRLADGTPNLEKMEEAVMSRDDIGAQKKLKILEYVKARGREDYVNTMRQQSADDRSFMNNAITMVKGGGDIGQLTAFANAHGRDPYDTQIKVGLVQKMFDRDNTDPDTYLNLYEKAQNGTLSKEENFQAVQAGKISVNHYMSLGEKVINNKLGGDSPDQKLGWEQVKRLAGDKFRDGSQQYKDFLMVMHNTPGIDDMPQEQMVKTAQDKLEKAPSGHWYIPNSPQWKADLTQLNTQNTEWGTRYQMLGRDVVNAIGQGALSKGQPKWGLPDVDAVIQAAGGQDAMKPGAPGANAVRSLMRHKQIVTPGNVKAVLEKHPDGNY